MTLTLRAVSLNDVPLSQPIIARFDEQGGTIGRTDNNTLALPDPERHISRQQAEIRAEPAGYLIRNVGSANPIVVRNQTLSFGETATLVHSDRVRIGGYLLEVIDDEASSPEMTVIRSAMASQALLGGGGGMGSELSSANPFADLLAPLPPPSAAPDSTLPAGRASTVSMTSAPMAHLPDDFDPFAAPAPAPAPAATARAESNGPAGVFGDLVPGGGPSSIDEMFGLRGNEGSDLLADFVAEAPPPRAERRGSTAPASLSTDPLVLFGAPSPPAPVPQLPPDRAHDLEAAFQPPPVAAPRAAAASVRVLASVPAPKPVPAPKAVVVPLPTAPSVAPLRVAPAPAAAADVGAWQAFCEGAGVRVEPPEGGEAEALRIAGVLLRQAVEGTLRLMSVRATTRQEMHAEVTVIRAANNNPLKFSPDAQSALEQLLRPPMRGFLSGPAAVADAMNDLVGHGIGTMTGTRAALDGMLARFAPQQLVSRLAGRSVLDALLPMNRKARLWELYLQRFEELRGDAVDNFHELFGKAFLEAYEQQVDRLQREQSRPGATG